MRHSCIRTGAVLCLSFVILSGPFIPLFAEGLPGEYLVTQRWRYLFSSFSPLSNPAFIDQENYISGRYALTSTLGTYYMHEAGVTIPLGLYKALGATWLMQGTSPYYQTQWQGTEIATTDRKINDQQNFFMLSYADNIWAGLTLGANLNIIHRTWIDTMDLGIGADLGLSYHMRDPLLGEHVLGISAQNLFTMILSSSEQYAKALKFALNSSYWEHRIISGINLDVKDLLAASKEFQSVDSNLNLLTAAQKVEWDLTAKLGFWIFRLLNLYGMAGFDEGGMQFWGFAGGFNTPSMNMGRDLSFLYQYISMIEGVAATHTLYIKSDFGRHREEIYARKMAKLANVSPNELYNKALTLYSAKNYWDAYFVFCRIAVEYPDFFKNDWVNYYSASCQEYLDMRNGAELAYTNAKTNYSRSAIVPYTDLGLMRIFYREENWAGVDGQFNEMNRLEVPDSLKFHAYYIMGQAQMRQGNHQKAKQLFDLIPDGHPDYIFAQHASAITEAIGGTVEGAVSALENCIQSAASTKAQQEAINRSYVFLGYIFYEDMAEQGGSLSKAVTALRMVPKTSTYYPEALLGLGWVALKARQWNDCIGAGQELVKSTTNPQLQAEGELLAAYAYMMQKNNSNAVTLLTSASQRLSAATVPTEEELNSKKQGYDGVRQDYNVLAEKVNELGQARQYSVVLKQIDSLHVNQKKFKSEIDEYLSFFDDFQRRSFFAKNLQNVKEDVDYALAKAQKLSGASTTTKIQQKTQEKEKAINEELNKLREQLEKEKVKE